MPDFLLGLLIGLFVGGLARATKWRHDAFQRSAERLAKEKR